MYAFLIVRTTTMCVSLTKVMRRGRDRWMRRGAAGSRQGNYNLEKQSSSQADFRELKKTENETPQLKFDICIWLNEMWLDSLTSALAGCGIRTRTTKILCAIHIHWFQLPWVSIIIISHEKRACHNR